MIQTGDARFRQPSSSSASAGSSGGILRDETVSTLDPTYLLPPQVDYCQRHGTQEALDRRRFELNNRIRFNHRGQVAMAMTVDDDHDDTNSVLQPQFFITLEDAGHLDGKHVLFGTVVGASIFNAIRIGQTDVDEETNQPASLEEAPRVLRTKVQSIDGVPEMLPALVQTPEPPVLPWHVNPFTGSTAAVGGVSGKHCKKKKARKGVKNINLLSFGEEMADEDVEGGGGGGGGIAQSKNSKSAKGSKNEKKKPPESIGSDDNDDVQNDRTKSDVAALPKPSKESTAVEQSQQKAFKPSSIMDGSKSKVEYQPIKQSEQQLSGPNSEEITSTEPPLNPNSKAKDSDESKVPHHTKKHKKISLVELRRAKYAKYQNKDKSAHNKHMKEEDTIAKLTAFRQKVAAAASNGNDDQKKKKRIRGDDDEHEGYSGQVTEDYAYDEKKDEDWMKTKFKCRRHMDHDARMGGDGRASSEYRVVEEKNSATDRKQDRRKNHHQKH